MEHGGCTFTAPPLGVVSRKRWRFELAGESTRASFTPEYGPKPAVVAPLADVLLLQRKWDQIYERGMQNLRSVIESAPAREAPTV